MLGLPSINNVTSCEAHSLGKQVCKEFPKGHSALVKAPLELIHKDLVGPMKTLTIHGNLYFFLQSPQQNKAAERKKRTVAEMVRTMLQKAKIPSMFWGEAVVTIVFIVNHC